MGIQPPIGGVFMSDEFNDPYTGALLVSWNYRKVELGSDPHVIGRTLRLENVPPTVTCWSSGKNEGDVYSLFRETTP